MKVMRSLEKRDLVKTIKSIKVGFDSGFESKPSPCVVLVKRVYR
jgi:hypothetical protein